MEITQTTKASLYESRGGPKIVKLAANKLGSYLFDLNVRKEQPKTMPFFLSCCVSRSRHCLSITKGQGKFICTRFEWWETM
jgi:hypothetical protein